MPPDAKITPGPPLTFPMRRGDVLCFGRDAGLLRTRVAVLTGIARVQSATDLMQMVDLATHQRFDLIILCHTLSDADCGLAFQVARRNWPEAQILAVASSSRGCSSENYDEVFSDWFNPRAFVERVTVLLGRKTGN